MNTAYSKRHAINHPDCLSLRHIKRVLYSIAPKYNSPRESTTIEQLNHSASLQNANSITPFAVKGATTAASSSQPLRRRHSSSKIPTTRAAHSSTADRRHDSETQRLYTYIHHLAHTYVHITWLATRAARFRAEEIVVYNASSMSNGARSARAFTPRDNIDSPEGGTYIVAVRAVVVCSVVVVGVVTRGTWFRAGDDDNMCGRVDGVESFFPELFITSLDARQRRDCFMSRGWCICSRGGFYV